MKPEEALEKLYFHKNFRMIPLDSETTDIAIEALEKQIPIEHHHTVVNHINDEIRTSICPSCLSMIHTHKADFPKFCNECGQAIDWSEEE